MPDAAAIDAAPPDAMPTCPGDVLGFEPTNFDTCMIAEFDGPYSLGPEGAANTWTLTTTNGVLTDPNGVVVAIPTKMLPQNGGPELLVVSVDSLVVPSDGRLRVQGTRPAVIVAKGDITIAGLLAAGAIGAGQDGPGGSNCTNGAGASGATQPDGDNDSGGSGGGGGGFGGTGGTGAKVQGSNGNSSAAGTQEGDQILVPLRSGCRGGAGGNDGGSGGGAGGAIQLVAGGTITVAATSGIITARGGGGGGGVMPSSGGGGGGSGGAIFLEAPAIRIHGTVVANGGGGGEGADGDTDGAAGQNGQDSKTRALGGATTDVGGGNGGSGGADGDTSSGDNGQEGTGSPATGTAKGGGGGGGGVGRIRLRAITTLDIPGAAIVSPTPYTQQ